MNDIIHWKTETVAKHVQEVIDQKLKEEGIEYRVDEENAKRVAAAILDSVIEKKYKW